MPRSTLDETLIRAAARVTDWHAAHGGMAVGSAVTLPPPRGGAMPAPLVHAADRPPAGAAVPHAVQESLPRG